MSFNRQELSFNQQELSINQQELSINQQELSHQTSKDFLILPRIILFNLVKSTYSLQIFGEDVNIIQSTRNIK